MDTYTGDRLIESDVTRFFDTIESRPMGEKTTVTKVTLINGFEMIETIKSTGAESGYFERWAGFFSKQNNDNVAIARFTQYIGALPELVDSIADLIMLFSGVYLIMHGEFTIGMLMAFQSSARVMGASNGRNTNGSPFCFCARTCISVLIPVGSGLLAT